MNPFHSFTAPVGKIFFGNLLLFFCSVFYLIWWVIRFRPRAAGGPAGTFCLAAAFLSGIAAVVLMSGGIRALSPDSGGLPVSFILAGTLVCYLLLFLATVFLFHRKATSELLLLHVWAALELSAVAVLYGTGRFGAGRAAVLTVLVGAASAVGLICYVLYYRLGGAAGYRDGMIPLLTDALVMAVFLGTLAVS